jgi:hypothetical protein
MQKNEFEHTGPGPGIGIWIRRAGAIGGILGSVGGTLIGAGVVWGVAATRIQAAEKAIEVSVTERVALREEIRGQAIILSRVDARLQALIEFHGIDRR